MAYGYNGKILRVNLSSGGISVEEPPDSFYRKYFGGVGFVGYFLLREVPPDVDALSPENKLIFAPGIITGAPVAGASRNAVGAKSPLTGGYGKAEGGGFFGAELKHAGFDAVIVEGKADHPVYIWIQDGQVEIRDARHLWGMATKESQEAIRAELGDRGIRTAQIGPGGENLVRFACIINDLQAGLGRTGLGAVMGSKNLKAVAVRGHNPPQMADGETLGEYARQMAGVARKREEASASAERRGLLGGTLTGNLPTRNFRDGYFEGAEKLEISRIQTGKATCWACPLHCRPVVEMEEPYYVDPAYAGPPYETKAVFGSNCGVDDIRATARASHLCNAYSIDTISTGGTIAFAMECFENGLITREQTGGLELTFGNAEAMLAMVEKIARREGLGDMLAEGSRRAAQEIGRGAEQYSMQVKGVEFGMHEPRLKHGLGLGYAVLPHGADHGGGIQDTGYAPGAPGVAGAGPLGVLEGLPIDDLGPRKVRMAMYLINWRNMLDSLLMCISVPYDRLQLMEIVRAVTGWDTSIWEALKVGERVACMARAYNLREGLSVSDDELPERFFQVPSRGSLKEKGMAMNREVLERAKHTYYGMMGWHRETGIPTREKLEELDIGWAADELAKAGLLAE